MSKSKKKSKSKKLIKIDLVLDILLENIGKIR